jgi:hypothetical protein
VPVLLLLAGAIILVGVVIVAMGRGGEMAEFPSDNQLPNLDALVTAADVAGLRPPPALWGYSTRVTDAALGRIARVVTERDVEIAMLRQQVAELRAKAAAASEAAGPGAAGELAAGGPPGVAGPQACPTGPDPAGAAPPGGPSAAARPGSEPAAVPRAARRDE